MSRHRSIRCLVHLGLRRRLALLLVSTGNDPLPTLLSIKIDHNPRSIDHNPRAAAQTRQRAQRGQRPLTRSSAPDSPGLKWAAALDPAAAGLTSYPLEIDPRKRSSQPTPRRQPTNQPGPSTADARTAATRPPPSPSNQLLHGRQVNFIQMIAASAATPPTPIDVM